MRTLRAPGDVSVIRLMLPPTNQQVRSGGRRPFGVDHRQPEDRVAGSAAAALPDVPQRHPGGSTRFDLLEPAQTAGPRDVAPREGDHRCGPQQPDRPAHRQYQYRVNCWRTPMSETRESLFSSVGYGHHALHGAVSRESSRSGVTLGSRRSPIAIVGQWSNFEEGFDMIPGRVKRSRLQSSLPSV